MGSAVYDKSLISFAVLSLCLVYVTECTVSITKLSIPRHVYISQNVTLRCEFDLGGFKLYSVKWYKDNAEIFRYIPSQDPPTRRFNAKGIILDVQKSTPQSIRILGAEKDTSGNYACEVTVDNPDLDTKYIEKEMNVLDVPKHGPDIKGIRTKYAIGDEIFLNCTSAPSFRPTRLTWWINNKKVGSNYLIRYRTYIFNNGSRETKLGIKFALKSKNIRSGIVRVRCRAAIASLHVRYTERILLVEQGHSSVVLQKKVISGEHKIGSAENDDRHSFFGQEIISAEIPENNKGLLKTKLSYEMQIILSFIICTSINVILQ